MSFDVVGQPSPRGIHSLTPKVSIKMAQFFGNAGSTTLNEEQGDRSFSFMAMEV
jgi:hypothetical protein